MDIWWKKSFQKAMKHGRNGSKDDISTSKTGPSERPFCLNSEALWGSTSFVNCASKGRTERTRRFDAQEKVEVVVDETEVVRRAKAEVLPLLAERGVGNRKLRAAIESIELDQEAITDFTDTYI